MNTTVVGAILQVAFDRLVPHAGDAMEFLCQDVNAELDGLKSNFMKVKGVLHDAEQKQIENPDVEDWLGKLRRLAYDIEDLLDSLATDAKAWKLEKESETPLSQVRTIISPILKFWSEREQVDKIKSLTKKFDQITNQSHNLSLIHGIRESAMGVKQRDLTTSIVNESFIYGRDNDVERILQQILSADESSQDKISVIPIVGLGGVGKTTLAQLVYNHEKLKDRFNLKLWVCVSNEFDLTRITKAILESITGESPNQKELQSLQTNLQHQLKDKKFLLVLDDVWTEKPSDWDRLQAPFKDATNGSCVVLTTRSQKVVSAIMGTVENDTLGTLSDADSEKLFYQQAFVDGNATSYPKLKEIGDKIVKKCKGLPLAAKTLGGLLALNPDIAEWEHVLNNDIWNLSGSDIIPSLRVSYHYLPSPLKRCFAYCAMFPQDYEFNKEELVLLWMAEGFLLPQGSKRMEDIGDQYFRELLSRSFFQRSLNGYGHPVFVMHDLIHDLAKSISKEICLNLGDHRIKVDESWKNDKSLVRHILVFPAHKFKVMSRFGEARRLRSLIFQSYDGFYVSKRFLYDVVPELRCLRVLSLKSCENIEQLPESIGNLKGLRYLNLSNTRIERLPESVSTLYNLQTLKLLDCRNLVQLPNDMGNLTDLRLLLIDNFSKLKKMPLGIGKLTNLQSLPTFVVGKHDEPNIKDLRDMQQLREILSIERLENVVDAWEATQAKLGSKEHLRTLNLNWSYRHDEVDSRDEEDVIYALRPHTNIRELRIQYYGGKRLPDWLGFSSYSMLETLVLEGCRNCECLPPLGCLRSLKHLEVYGLDGVKKVDPEFYGDVCVVEPFVSLESLIFHDMKGLEEWSGIEDEFKEEFPRLRKLEVRNCPNLREFPCRFPQLEELEIFYCEKLISLPRFLPMLQKLNILRCHEKILRSAVEFPLPLTRFCISSIANLKHLPLEEGRVITECLTTLRELQIQDCNELVTLLPPLNNVRGGLQRLESLQDLEISSCNELVCLSEVDEDRLPPKLENLTINKCKKLQKLPRGAHEVTLLGDIVDSKLRISDCPNLMVSSFLETASFSMLRSLEIFKCKVEFPEEIMLPSTLKELDILCCSGFETLPVRMMHNASCLKVLRIDQCPSFALFPEEMELPSTLKSVSIFGCDNVKTLPDGFMRRDNEENSDDSFIESLVIHLCPSLTSFTVRASSSRFPLLPKIISIYGCRNLVALPTVMLHDNKFLETLEIECCDSLKSFERRCLGFDACADVARDPAIRRRTTVVSNVKRIDITCCKNLESLPYGMDNLASLQSLIIKECDRLASFPDGGLPTATLTELHISDCKSLNPFPENGFPGSLTSLTIQNCKEPKPMSEWGLHKLTSLRFLSIGGFSGRVSLPMRLLPPNLTHLYIKKLTDLICLEDGLGSLASLEILYIEGCDKLEPFLETDLPSSFSELHVSGCPAIEEWCAKETEKDGSNIVKTGGILNKVIYRFFE